MAMIEVRATQSSPAGARASRLRRGHGGAGLIALVFLLSGCQDAAAQEGVVLEVTTRTAEETFPLEAAIGAELGKDGIAALMNALGWAANALDASLQGELTKLKAGSALFQLNKALSGHAVPALSTMDYTVYLRDDLMAVAAKGAPVMVWDVTDPGMSRMWFLDPATGRPITIPGTDGEGIRLGSAEAMQVDEGALVDKPAPTGATRKILGYTAHEYTYKVSLLRKLAPGAAGPGMDVAVHIEGEAWVVPTSPFRDQIARFYRSFAAGVGEPGAAASGQSGHLASLTAHMAAIAELGVPMETTEDITTLLVVTGEDGNPTGAGVPLSKAATSSTVTSIRRAPIDDEQYYGKEGKPGAPTAGAAGQSPAAPERPACDCSCEAYAKLDKLSRASKEEQAADPSGMATAMCAPQCAMKWIACKR